MAWIEKRTRADGGLSAHVKWRLGGGHRRVNMVNERREFFFATPTEVREVLMQKYVGLLEYAEQPEAPEYFQSRSRWPEGVDRGPS